MEGECPVCCEILDRDKEEIVKLNCGHEYHYNCIFLSYRSAISLNRYSTKRECPYCRSKGEYLQLKPGLVPIKGIHQEYSNLAGNLVKVDILREKYFDPNKCQSILVSGSNKFQQCSRKASKDAPPEKNMCSLHLKNKSKNGSVYFPV
jgi:hypothetical protein